MPEPNQPNPVVQNIDFSTGQVVNTPPPGDPTGAPATASQPVQPGSATTAPQPPQGVVFEPPRTEAKPLVTPPVETAPAGNLPKTQEEFNQVLNVRLEAERKKFADYDTLKQKAGELDTIKESQKTEGQRLQEQLADLQTKQAQAQATAQQATLKAAVVSEAAKLGFADPMDAFNLIDAGKLKQKEDGSFEGLTEALTELGKTKAYLITRRPAVTVGATNPPRDSASPTRTDADRSKEYFGGGGGSFWQGGGVRVVTKQE